MYCNVIIQPDQMSGAAAYITREWGDGYTVRGIDTATRHVTLFHVTAGDGSRFTVAADRWGNCRHQDTGQAADETLAEALAPLVAEMHAAAIGR